MSWIKIVSYNDSAGTLRKLYDRVKGANNYIDNILVVHSLRPPTLKGHLALYKNVLHHRDNTIPKWLLEALGVYVSHLNSCAYCVNHHFEGLKTLVDNSDKSEQIRTALLTGHPEKYFSEGDPKDGAKMHRLHKICTRMHEVGSKKHDVKKSYFHKVALSSKENYQNCSSPDVPPTLWRCEFGSTAWESYFSAPRHVWDDSGRPRKQQKLAPHIDISLDLGLVHHCNLVPNPFHFRKLPLLHIAGN